MQKQKRAGDFAEDLVVEFLTGKGFECDKSKGKNYDYDVSAKNDKIELTFEVKYDIMSEKTGNIALEYWNCRKNEPSGITVTKSDYWVFVLTRKGEHSLHFAKVAELKKFIDDVTPKKIIPIGGDKNASLMLYDEDVILPAFTESKDFSLE